MSQGASPAGPVQGLLSFLSKSAAAGAVELKSRSLYLLAGSIDGYAGAHAALEPPPPETPPTYEDVQIMICAAEQARVRCQVQNRGLATFCSSCPDQSRCQL